MLPLMLLLLPLGVLFRCTQIQQLQRQCSLPPVHRAGMPCTIQVLSTNCCYHYHYVHLRYFSSCRRRTMSSLFRRHSWGILTNGSVQAWKQQLCDGRSLERNIATLASWQGLRKARLRDSQKGLRCTHEQSIKILPTCARPRLHHALDALRAILTALHSLYAGSLSAQAVVSV